MKKILPFLLVYMLNTEVALSDERSCVCDTSVDIQENLNNSYLVFSGRVENTFPISDDQYIANVLVYEGWKNINQNSITVLSSSSPEDCGFTLSTGGEYLIYGFYPSFLYNIDLNLKKNETLPVAAVSKCGGSKKLSEVKNEEIQKLGTPPYNGYRK